MNTLLLTGYDSGMKELGDLCLPYKMAYADRWNLDRVVLRDCDYQCYYGHPSFQKLGHIEHYLFRKLHHYDIVWWMDADSVITNPELDPRTLMSEAHLTVSWDYNPEDQDPRPIQLQWSAGHMIWTRCAAAAKLLHIARKQTQFAYSGLWDQDALQHVVAMYPHLAPRTLTTRAMNSVLPGLTGTQRADWEPIDLLCHFTGIAPQDRVRIAREFIKLHLT